MFSVLAAIVFAAASVGCAHRLRHAERAREYLVFTPFIVGAWVVLLGLREPTALNMTLNFILLDMTIMLLACFGIFRMLGAFDADPYAATDDDGPSGNDEDPRGPVLPDGPGASTAPPIVRPSLAARRPRGAQRHGRRPQPAPRD